MRKQRLLDLYCLTRRFNKKPREEELKYIAVDDENNIIYCALQKVGSKTLMGLLEKDRESRKMWDGMFFKDSLTTRKKKSYCEFKLIWSLLWSVNLFNGCFPPSKRDIEMGNHCAILTDITEKNCVTLETWRSQPRLKRRIVIMTSVFLNSFSILLAMYHVTPFVDNTKRSATRVF